jgi:hypothetical protein
VDEGDPFARAWLRKHATNGGLPSLNAPACPSFEWRVAKVRARV